ncbi:MAG: DUF2851 family protein [Bacteroidia bacterium]
MREDFLHFLWKFKLFNTQELFTIGGEPVQIVKTGTHNFNAGPDFLHAKIQIGETLWAGNVEIHIKTSDWDAHKHSEDDAYNNVILHVVYIDDRKNASTPTLPKLEIKDLVPQNAVEIYNNFLENKQWIPCATEIQRADDFTRNIWLERMLIDRLETKSQLIQKILQNTKNDWEQATYTWLVRSFGFKINADAFEELASRLPFLLLSKHSNSPIQTEALLFGQAGFLGDDITEEDVYFHQLKKEYEFLAKKYNLVAMRKENWKFMRMHAGNFPTIRIAQLAALVQKNTHLLSNLLKIKSIPGGQEFFQADISGYWQTHLLFGKQSTKKQSGNIGKESIVNLLINTVVPLQFCYGELRNKPQLKEQAQNLLLELPPENNNITRSWTSLGLQNQNAADSQALIQLKNNYCEAKKCLYCGIGTSILRKSIR